MPRDRGSGCRDADRLAVIFPKRCGNFGDRRSARHSDNREVPAPGNLIKQALFLQGATPGAEAVHALTYVKDEPKRNGTVSGASFGNLAGRAFQITSSSPNRKDVRPERAKSWPSQAC